MTSPLRTEAIFEKAALAMRSVRKLIAPRGPTPLILTAA
jgi:hypothetical protein